MDKSRNRVNKNVYTADFSSYHHNDGRNFRERHGSLGFEAAAAAFHAVNAENHPGKGFAARTTQQHPGFNTQLKRNERGKGRGIGANGADLKGSFDVNQCIGFMKVEWSKVLNLIEADANAVVWYQTDETRPDCDPLHEHSCTA